MITASPIARDFDIRNPGGADVALLRLPCDLADRHVRDHALA